MKIKYFERVTKEAYLADIMESPVAVATRNLSLLFPPGADDSEQPGPSEGKGKGLVAYF